MRLWIEFLILFVFAPIGMAVFLPPSWLFPALFGLTFLGLMLLHRTDEFHWGELGRGWRDIPVFFTLGFCLATAAVCWGVMSWRHPDAMFLMVRANPWVLGMITLLYPFLSALPQELVYRPLFFRRYGALIGRRWALPINASVFALAHLMYWNWIVAAMTFAGGVVFAWAYAVRGSFVLALVLHSLAGIILFTFGMGVYFYSGNVVRPF